jgi:hypothetical protein
MEITFRKHDIKDDRNIFVEKIEDYGKMLYGWLVGTDPPHLEARLYDPVHMWNSMRKILFVIVMLFLNVPSLQAGNPSGALPNGAFVIETQSLSSQGYPERQLILWMLKPTKHPREGDLGVYACPEETRGSYYSGPTRVSLFDNKTNRIINTVSIVQEYSDNEDSFDLPYRIHAGS